MRKAAPAKRRDVGVWLLKRRGELGLSQQEVAHRAGRAFDASTLSKVERGKIAPSAELLTAIAPIYGVEVPWLYRLGGLFPETTKVAEPAPVYATVDTMEAIERAIRDNRDLDESTKDGLVLSAKLLVTPHLDEARRRKRARGRRAG